MRILIDECIDERFRNSLAGHDCQTARYAGLAGLKNGELLAAAESAKFDVFLTVDQGIELPAEPGKPKHRNNHFSCKVEPFERPVATCVFLPGAHCSHSTRPDRSNRGLGRVAGRRVQWFDFLPVPWVAFQQPATQITNNASARRLILPFLHDHLHTATRAQCE